MTISAQTFAFVADHVRRKSAIQLDTGKEYLVESRLLPLARAAGLPDVDAFVATLRSGPAAARGLEDVVEALTTNETSWFRDVTPFDALRQHILPALQSAPGGLPRLRLWSGACSTGQEPYSIAMILSEAMPGLPLEITATDLSEQVLSRARTGEYSQLEVNRGLPAPLLVKYMKRNGSHWQVADELRRKITFRRANLLESPPLGGPFDVVFLRNVLIYFDLATKRAVLDRVRGALRPGGFLVLGAAETTIGVHEGYERVVVGRGAVYRATNGPTLPHQAPPSTVESLRHPVTPVRPAARPAPLSSPVLSRGAGLK
ncbi:CheR family methyltransferase [Cellulomonas oligotrophica]|uniref:protein-glutamate O-methyltransferase n=1 Tax=Cellulomonas oligotrophica TaxID=931536 RepID=A0A7Y9FH71_9CELL|nr:protein-glutamate O-methyltransferase CheR [Cellulomonas oligotrophica]NYD87280.1 chemotaxis protein methyltransferase CheR [Cellulomonas oligotrophica]GIG34197.1 chemotaxis protein methyltransferase [Cellulomonas oligotrophica]